MYGYTVHLLFHVLAGLVGIACGVAGGYWLLDGNETAMWLFVATILVGMAVLVVQASYIRNIPTKPRRPQRVPQGSDTFPSARSGNRSSPHIDIADSSDRSGATGWPRESASAVNKFGTRRW